MLFSVLDSIVGKKDLIVGDAANKRLIFDLYDKGLNILACTKGGGSVGRGIKTIQGYQLIVTKESANIKKALNNYSWHDSRSETPKHDWSDLCDAFRYGAMELIEFY